MRINSTELNCGILAATFSRVSKFCLTPETQRNHKTLRISSMTSLSEVKPIFTGRKFFYPPCVFIQHFHSVHSHTQRYDRICSYILEKKEMISLVSTLLLCEGIRPMGRKSGGNGAT